MSYLPGESWGCPKLSCHGVCIRVCAGAEFQQGAVAAMGMYGQVRSLTQDSAQCSEQLHHFCVSNHGKGCMCLFVSLYGQPCLGFCSFVCFALFLIDSRSRLVGNENEFSVAHISRERCGQFNQWFLL